MSLLFPVFLRLEGRRCVVVGGGAVAEGKVASLLECGACVTVIAPQLTARMEAWAREGAIRAVRRPYREGDLAGACLVIAATGDPATNRRVWEEAERSGAWLNAVDDPDHCHFMAPAVYRSGDLAVAVSTGGRCPALAVRVRDRIARLLGPEYGRLVTLLGNLRDELRRRVPDPSVRRQVWYDLVDSAALEHLRRGDWQSARRCVESVVGAHASAGREVAR